MADGFVDNVTVEDVGDDAALLAGIRGTYPAVAPSTGEATFGDRFAEFAPEGTPTVFSAHMYDCLATLVLAAQVAQSSDPTVYVDEIIGVTRDGEKCSLVADCLEMVWAGTDIDYDGASGPLDFSPNGEPSTGVYNVIEYNAEGVVREPGRDLRRPAFLRSQFRCKPRGARLFSRAPLHASGRATIRSRTPRARGFPGTGQ